jgi:amino acid adenylation domain-containing protein/non-ribosomal peptide synthase protein (TIGR01720 family)
MHDSQLRQWADRVCLVNSYGPAECSVTSVVGELSLQSHPASIGYGVGGLTWIVHPENPHRLLPVGVPGEMLVEGPILARGYLHEPEKTKASFVQNLAWADPQRRFYRTGDLVKYDIEGRLIFLGRKDTQVKLRGQRIDLSEVENAMTDAAPNILDATVELVKLPQRGDRQDNQVLVACFRMLDYRGLTSGDGMRLEITPSLQKELRRLESQLSNSLPIYMIPSIYVPFKIIPTTRSDKIDRRKIREIVMSIPPHQISLYALSSFEKRQPVTDAERRLQQLWAEVLDIDDVGSIGADDNFFRLGGDSISAIRLVAAARRVDFMSIAHERLDVPTVFKKPRLCDMADYLTLAPEKAVMELQPSPLPCNNTKTQVRPFSLLRPSADINEIRGVAASYCGVSIEEIEDVLPCTPLQQGLLALSERRPGDYVAEFSYKLRGDVNNSQFKKAWNNTTAVLPILRTRILSLTDEGIVQAVLRTEESFRTTELQRNVFRLGSPLQTTTLHEDPQTGSKHFVLRLHHALYDGWSLPKILETLTASYNGDLALQPAQFSFSAFVQHVTNIEEGLGKKYWRQQFDGLDAQQFPQLPSPEYHPMPKQLYQHDTKILPPVQTDFTLSTAIRAAWAIVVAKYSNSTEAVFGAVVSGRQIALPGIETIVGPTIATVPVRISLDENQSVEALLHQIQQQSAQMVKFEQIGLQNIRRVSHEASQACEFQSLVVVQPNEDVETGHELFEMNSDPQPQNEHAISIIEGFGTFSLMLDLIMGKQGLQIRIAFDQKVISKQQVRRLSQQFELVLRQICSEDQREAVVGKVKTVTDQDLDDIWRWNQDPPRAVEECIHDRIAVTFHQYQDSSKIVIDAWDGALTYAELDQLSTQLATELGHQGVGSGVMVPLLFEKSMWMSVAMLAVMKAGAIGVALDTTQPLERLRTIISQIDVRMILASRQHRNLSKQTHEAPVLVVDGDALKTMDRNRKLERILVDPADDLCVVFTSGSTGKPKGVRLTHRNFATAIDCHRSIFNVSSTSRIYDFASYSFDFAWSNLLLTLFSGACLCVPSEHERRDDPVTSIARFRATFGFFTPALARIFKPELLPSLQTLLVGGEKFRTQDLPSFHQSCSVWVVYGPTESTVLATSARLQEIQDEEYMIGRGMATNTWVVSDNELCAIGSVGELWLEGPLVGRGYLNNAEKTHEVFVEDPDWLKKGGPSQPGRRGRLYKTGDLVRYNSDGSIIFVGRKDNQIKVRGQRVELGDVDHHVYTAVMEALMRPTLIEDAHGWVKDGIKNSTDKSIDTKENTSDPNTPRYEVCVVSEVVRFRMSTHPRLVSFVSLDKRHFVGTVTEHNEAVRCLTKDIEGWLATRVPAYMCPTAFIAVYDMPMTVTGKFDRNRLRDIAAGMSLNEIRSRDAKSSRSIESPATETELRLDVLWKKILNISEDIDVDADFFQIGGDSITAMQISSAAKGSGLFITVADIVKYKTMRKIASACRPFQRIPDKKQKTAGTRGDPFPLTPIQQWFMGENPEGNVSFDVRFYLELAHKVPTEALQQGLRKVVERHSMLRARFQKQSSGLWAQRVTEEVDSSFKLTLVSDCEDAALQSALTECRDSIDIALGPIMSALHVQNSDKQFLFLVINHLVIDLVSFRVIFQDLEDILSGSEPSPIHSLDFQEWACLQEDAAKLLDPRQALNFDLEKERFDYWGLEATDIGKSSYTRRKFVLDLSTTSAILGWVNEINNSEPMELMIAALVYAFGSVFHDRTLPTVFSEGHGRESLDGVADVSQTVGWFTTMYPVQLQRDESTDLSHMIKHTTQTMRNIPRKGWEYFASRFLNTEGKDLFACSGMEINFNYLGIFQQLERSTGLFRRVPTPPHKEPPSAKKVKGLAIFEVVSVVYENQLEFDFSIDDRVENVDGVSRWIEMVQKTLVQMVEDANRSRSSTAAEGL